MDNIVNSLGLDMNGMTDVLNIDKRMVEQAREIRDQNALTVDKMKLILRNIRSLIEDEFVNPELPAKKEMFLKARLANILIIEKAFFAEEATDKKYHELLSNAIFQKMRKA